MVGIIDYNTIVFRYVEVILLKKGKERKKKEEK